MLVWIQSPFEGVSRVGESDPMPLMYQQDILGLAQLSFGETRDLADERLESRASLGGNDERIGGLSARHCGFSGGSIGFGADAKNGSWRIRDIRSSIVIIR